MDWNRFSFDYRLDLSGMTTTLISIEGLKVAAKHLLLRPAWKKQLDTLNRIRTVHGSTALEGNPLSEAQIADLLGGKAESDPESRESRQILNADTAQNWVRDRFEPSRRPISVEDILHMHRLMTTDSDEHDNVPGRLRTHPVTVGTPELGGVHRGAPYEDLPRLMADFAEFLNSRRLQGQHPVARALLAHFFLVTIHPFGDGNGRVSRLVEAAVLYGGGYNVHGFYGLSNYFYRNGDEYKRRLQECRRTQPFDVAPFVEFGLRGFARELRGINRFIKTKMNHIVYRGTLDEARAARVSRRRYLINPREFRLLSYLLEETEPTDPFSEHPSKQIRLIDLVDSPYVRSAYHRVTTRTFVRELYRLAELGFISISSDPNWRRQFVTIDFNAIEEMDIEKIAPY